MSNRENSRPGVDQQVERAWPRISLGRFALLALIAGAVAALVGFILGLFWYASQIMLLIFAATLFGIFLHGVSDWLRQHTPLTYRWALAAIVLGLVILFGLSVWLFAANIVSQINQFGDQLPQAVQQLRQRVTRLPGGQQMLAQVQDTGTYSGRLLSAASGFFGSTVDGLVNIVIVLIVGLYFAVAPTIYTSGIVRLVPPPKRKRAGEVLSALGTTLRWWLIGRFAIMAVNGLITGVALWLLGIPLAFGLGLLTGLLNFIPNIGPILAGIPAVLLALTQGTDMALYVILLFIVVQNLEGFVLTPLVQQRTVSLPAAVIIISQVLMGVLLGGLGVLLATPIAASVLVLIKLLYLEDTLNERVDVPEK